MVFVSYYSYTTGSLWVFSNILLKMGWYFKAFLVLALPTFCKTGDYLGMILDYWVSEENVWPLLSSACWDYNLKVSRSAVILSPSEIFIMDARPTFQLDLHPWFLLIQLKLIMRLKPQQLRSSAVVLLTTECFLLSWPLVLPSKVWRGHFKHLFLEQLILAGLVNPTSMLFEKISFLAFLWR